MQKQLRSSTGAQTRFRCGNLAKEQGQDMQNLTTAVALAPKAEVHRSHIVCHRLSDFYCALAYRDQQDQQFLLGEHSIGLGPRTVAYAIFIV